MVELWERQKGERDASYIYFHIYLHELKERPKKLQDVINYIDSLEPNGTLRNYKSNLIEVPTMGQLKKFSAKWKWQDRDIAYTNHLNQLDQEKAEEEYNQTNELVREGLEQDLKEIDEYGRILYDSDYSLTSKVNMKYTLARAKDLTIKNLRLSYGRSTSISESNDKLKVDANVEYTGLSELAEAFNEGRKQYQKRKQQ